MEPYAPTGTMLDALPNADVLLERRAQIVKQVAPLRARYGGAGNYLGERFFKVKEATLDVIVRNQAKADGEKLTEGAIEARVRTHPSYIEALTDEVKARQEWIELEEKLEEIDYRLEIRKSDSYLLGGEARLQ